MPGGTSGFTHPDTYIPPGKLAAHTSVPVWVTLQEELCFAASHLGGDLERGVKRSSL